MTILDYIFPFNWLSTWEVNLYSIGMYMKADLLFFLCHNPTSIKGVTALLDLCELHFLWQSVANDGHKRSFVIYALLANFYWSLWSSVKKYGKTFSFFVFVCRSFLLSSQGLFLFKIWSIGWILCLWKRFWKTEKFILKCVANLHQFWLRYFIPILFAVQL